MTRLPNDPIDPYESRLARRVGSFSDQAVLPIDPVAIAATARVAGRRRTRAGRLFGSAGPTGRLVLVGAGALLIVALGAVIGAGGTSLFGPSATAVATQGAVVPSASPTLVPGSDGSDLCSHRLLIGEITGWEGAAGHRIASVVVENRTTISCRLPTELQVKLADNVDRPLIVGPPVVATTWITLPPGGSATTLVQVGNYCGPAPVEPVTIAFTMPDGGVFGLAPHQGSGDLGGVPPCNGVDGPKDDIQMQPFTLGG